MNTRVIKTDLSRIQQLRELFLQEVNSQVRYNACHERGWTDSYLLCLDDLEVGYGSIKGQEIKDRDTVFEFYVIPPFRKYASMFFRELLTASQPKYIECQSNDALTSAMLFEFATNINADVVLFEHHTTSDLRLSGATFRPKREHDQIFVHEVEPVGNYVLELRGEIVATGGFFLHYNKPFADVYMEVAKEHRRKGAGSFLVQEVIKECFLAGRVPAARTGLDNPGSRVTLIKAGFRPSGFMLKGDVRKS